MSGSKGHHKGAMHASHASHKKAHDAEGLGVSEREAAPWGHGEFANMPSNVTMEMYHKNKGQTGVLDDTITGIDRTIDKSEGTSRRYLSGQH